MGYRLPLPHAGRWREILNSDALCYGGSGQGNLGGVVAEPKSGGAFPAAAKIVAPPLATLFFEYAPDGLE